MESLKPALQGHILTQDQMQGLIAYFMSGEADPVEIAGR